MAVPQDFASMQEQIQSALVATTKSVNQISSEDLAFHRSMNPELGKELEEKSKRLLEVAQSLLKSAASVSRLRVPKLQDVDDVENNWRGIVDVVDSLLEKADTSLDEYTDVIKRKGPGFDEESNPKKHPSQLGKSFYNQNLPKPQLAFAHKPQNADESPWKPLLTSKPHALVPLEESLGTFKNQFNHTQYRHPYEYEILQLKYPDTVYQKADPIKYLPVEKTTATWVDTMEGVREMLKELKKATEIAVDLEHHDTRSYVGLVSLMQISTREKDWIVDTLKPWRQDLEILNEVFTDPKIVKVFHGAYMDIMWLQRDLGLYVTGLFDTHHACRALGYPGGSLAYLLKLFVNFDADKKYQMADWRIRPLPEEMLFYARSDTHFLLYIYDNLRNELVEKSHPADSQENRIEIVLQKSKETSLISYERPIYEHESGKGASGWYTLLIKTPKVQTAEQLSVFRAVHAWRDQIARKDDDSTNFVMSNAVLSNIARNPPEDLTSLYGLLHPISYNVKSRVHELLDLIKAAKLAGKDGPTAMDILKPDSLGAMAKQIRESNPASRIAGPSSTIVNRPKIGEQESLRTDVSRFWGNAFGSSIWDSPASSSSSTGPGLTLAVQIAPAASKFFSTSFQTSMAGNSSQSHDVEMTEMGTKDKEEEPNMNEDKMEFPEEREDDAAFILKTSRKRKSDVISGADPDEGRDPGIIALDEADEAAIWARKHKRELRAARKAEKKAAKQAAEKEVARDAPVDEVEATEEPEKGAAEEDEDFDYSKAESVLHSKSGGSNGGGTGGKRRKKGKDKDKKSTTPFDPYSKSANAAKGMRRAQGGNGDGAERGSRSMTFKK